MSRSFPFSPDMDRVNKKKRMRGGYEEGDDTKNLGVLSNNHHQRRQKQSEAFALALVPAKPVSSPAIPGRPHGVFDFPWHDGRGFASAISELEGFDFRDVFFRSLVDGSMAKIGYPGDRLGKPPPPFSLLNDDGFWPSDDKMDGVDPAWKAVLSQQQPVIAGGRPRKVSKA